MPARHPPNLDAWAKDGRVFDHAFAPAPWTLPSFASIYTGHWPLIHQAGRIVRLDPGDAVAQAPVEYLPALAEILQTEGVQDHGGGQQCLPGAVVRHGARVRCIRRRSKGGA